MKIDQIFQKIWEQYSKLNPQAEKIHALLKEGEGRILNDHVAYRSVNLPGYGVDALKKPFVDKGYKVCGDYRFEAKKLYAVHLEHEDKTLPKVFISELLLEELSEETQSIYKKYFADLNLPEGDDLLTCGRRWDLDFKTYQKLAQESEYAAWLLAFGFCANHFTVNVNALENFNDLESLNSFLENHGYVLNASGGKIKGSPEVYLEQSSTMAGELSVNFSDGDHKIPSCYYEFALRYKLESGELYQGFVTGSADKIFESTNKSKS